ncbi:hypothetical protein B0G83_107118 [Paraburkholderia sp. BL21I4N1]|nr:hypothetical protein B0G83_107118 [Paraburkholderia sp. BL21I4N1]
MLPLGATRLPEVPMDSRDCMINNPISSDSLPQYAVCPPADIQKLTREARGACGKRGRQSLVSFRDDASTGMK